MKHRLLAPITGALALPIFCCSLGSTAVATEPRIPASAISASAQLDPDHVLYDEPGDGSLWALGASWKACFASGGATYYPRTGANEGSFPHALSPDLVTIGGVSLPFARSAQAVRTADRVALDRQLFVETYDLAPEHVEQSFVFASSPGVGDLVLRIPVASALGAVETAAGLEFRSPRGRVTYSRAVAVDALGRHTPAETRIADGAITIRVAAEVVAGAAWPLVVDPILGSIFPDAVLGRDTFEIDAAYDAFHGVWVVVYEHVFDANDHDVYAKMYDNGGTLIASDAVDFTIDSWVAPRIADMASAHGFLCVAGATSAIGGAKTVRGRIVQPSSTFLTFGSQFSVSGSGFGDCTRPDIGGDPTPTGVNNWCVVFERAGSSVMHDIGYCFVYADGTSVGPGFIPTLTNQPDKRPSISKSFEASNANWLIAWDRQTLSGTGDILGARITNGGTLGSTFTIAGGTPADASPAVSSAIAGTALRTVTWVRGVDGVSGGQTIMVALLDGQTILQTADLMALENSSTQLEEQFEPSVDSDGEHFLVSYSEGINSSLNSRVFVTDLAVVGNSLHVAQGHLDPDPTGNSPERRSNVAASRVGGALDHRYLVVYDVSNFTDLDVVGRFVDGVGGGTTSLFCFDTVGVCPCGDSGLGVGGCANSVNASGGTLSVSGTPSTLSDTLVLQAGALPPNTTCLFFQGTSAIAPVIFGDGLRCAAGTVVRLVLKNGGPTGSVDYPTTGEPRVSVNGLVPVGGGMRAYQVWYRNAAAFCTSATFNLTNGAIVNWAR